VFIEQDERFLIMNLAGLAGYPALSVSNFQALEAAGVRTIEFSSIAHLAVDWQTIYSQLSAVLENTNLKILCPFWRNSPKDLDWLLNGEINYGDPAVGKSIDEVTLRFIDGLGNNRDRVQVTYAPGVSGGEVDWMHFPYRVIPGGSGFGREAEPPPVSDEGVAEFIVNRQKILSAQYNEVWTSFVNTQIGPHHPRRMIIENALYDAYPDCAHYRVNHWYFPNLETDHSRSMVRENSRSKYFVGSDWVAGLETNYDAGMEQGVWGFITAPIHIHSGKSALSASMVDIIRTAIEKLSNEN
jgi:hypothetical protein